MHAVTMAALIVKEALIPMLLALPAIIGFFITLWYDVRIDKERPLVTKKARWVFWLGIVGVLLSAITTCHTNTQANLESDKAQKQRELWQKADAKSKKDTAKALEDSHLELQATRQQLENARQENTNLLGRLSVDVIKMQTAIHEQRVHFVATNYTAIVTQFIQTVEQHMNYLAGITSQGNKAFLGDLDSFAQDLGTYITGLENDLASCKRVQIAGDTSPQQAPAMDPSDPGWSANPDAEPLAGPAPLTVSFRSQVRSRIPTQLLSYTWNFGDHETSSEANPSHTYSSPGDYVAMLLISNRIWSSCSQPLHITVLKGLKTPPPTSVLSISPPALDFGTVALNETSNITVSVQNIGGKQLHGLANVAATNAVFQLTTADAYDLRPGESYVFTIKYAPTQIGSDYATLFLTGDASTSVPISGNCDKRPPPPVLHLIGP